MKLVVGWRIHFLFHVAGFQLIYGGYGSSCIVGAKESFKGWDALLDYCKKMFLF